MSPALQIANARRTTARIILIIVVALMTTLVLFSGGPIGTISFAQQQTTSAVAIKFMNPDSETSTEVTATTIGNETYYHLVAWVNTLPTDPSVKFKYQASGAQEQDIGTGTQVSGTQDTFEFKWQLANMPADGAYTLKVQLFSGQTLVSTDTESVTLNNTDPASTPPPSASETKSSLEITYPANGGATGFYQRGGSEWKAQIEVTPSTATDNVQVYYTVSTPGADPEWKSCNSSNSGAGETRTDATNDGVTCTLQGADQPSQVKGIAAVSVENDQLAPQNNFIDKDSGDAHRTNGYAQIPTTVQITQNQSQRVDLLTGTTKYPCSGAITVKVSDQNGRLVAGAHLDVHAQGPGDSLQFDDSDTGNAHKNPDQGSHTQSEPTADCEASDPSTTAGSSNQGEHELAGDDIKHIETTVGTNDKGEFSFKLLAKTAGSTHGTVFADNDGNDLLCSQEPQAAFSIGWGQDAPAASGVQADQTSCPSPTSTSPAPGSTSPTPSNTTTTPGGTTTPPPSSPPPPPPSESHATTVTIDHDRNSFDGKVKSDTAKCERGRKVVLKKKRPGRDKVVGSDTTNGEGEYSIPLRRADGVFYAVAPRDTFERNDGVTDVCLKGRSPNERA